jgi:hypothetical protein
MAELRLDGFDGLGSIRRHKVLVFGKPEDCLRFVNVLEADSLYKGRTVLVANIPGRGSVIPTPLTRRRWDALFTPKENFDYQMILTYVENSPKPCRVVWWNADIPRAIWTRWSGSKDITVIGSAAEGNETMCGSEWEAIFFPLVCRSEFMERVLSKRGSGMRGMVGGPGGIAGSLEDIREKGAAVCWSSIDENDSRGALYWYDPGEGQEVGGMTRAEAVEVLEGVRQFLLSDK